VLRRLAATRENLVNDFLRCELVCRHTAWIGQQRKLATDTGNGYEVWIQSHLLSLCVALLWPPGQPVYSSAICALTTCCHKTAPAMGSNLAAASHQPSLRQGHQVHRYVYKLPPLSPLWLLPPRCTLMANAITVRTCGRPHEHDLHTGAPTGQPPTRQTLHSYS
jgi:hypothetical protein